MNLLHETGLRTILHSSRDAKLLILIRFLRFFAFGGSTIVLALLLHSLSLSDSKIGAFMSLTLIGDVLSFFLTTFADGLGRRTVLAVGCSMMIGSGVAFALTGTWWVLVVAGVVGIISPNGREIGPFSAIEESTLASLTPSEKRSDVFAWYALTGSAGGALGKFVTGWMVSTFIGLGWTDIRAYRSVFVVYAGLGIIQLAIVACLSSEVELYQPSPEDREVEEPLLGSELDEERESTGVKIGPKKSLLPRISKESRAVVFKLCVLFALDSTASGLVPSSWVTYFFFTKFHLSTSSLGNIFSIAAILSAASALVAASLSKRIGLIRTMVFTHLPSAIALGLLPFAPTLSIAIFLLLFRFSLASMDIAPKAAFLSAVILPSERTAVMGFVNMVRTGSQSLGPVITGSMSQLGKGWAPFVAAGAMKAVYDLSLLGTFYRYKNREDAQSKLEDEDDV